MLTRGLVVVFSLGVYFALYFYSLCLNRGATTKPSKREKGRQYRIKHYYDGPGYLPCGMDLLVKALFPYPAQKPQAILIALGYRAGRRLVDKRIYRRCLAQADAGIVCFLYVGCFPGMKSLKVVDLCNGIAMFIMSILYVVMAVTAPAITNVLKLRPLTSPQSFIPHIDLIISPSPSLCWSLRLVGQEKSALR